ncbi:hypothetical protein [Myxococcus landrumensis]|uniref:Lipoprotein n=1 Tax=Myxococcus landrumensis TaxID=2813577 RepID=A0ABX7NE72_9BACT|nr:hypothetical protein [Myxococcus landrumus]QSQ17114.1 hypothetical protein JY572_14085 [Myxococcus landrumus]
MNFSRWLFAGVGMAFLVAGCGGRQGSSRVDLSKMGPSLNDKRYANLEKLAAQDLKCAEELKPTYLGENQYQMSGCGTEGVYELHCRMGQCSWIPDVRARAEFDLGCPRAQLTTTNIDKFTVGVAGCSKRATYRKLGSTYNVTWVLNSQVSQDAAPVAAPTSDSTPL